MTKRPNIVIFNPDQYRGDAVGHMGNAAAMTPNLDRFVTEDAVSFRHAFCQLPVCTPSRCSFMSGWYPHVRGHRSQLYMMQPDEPVLLKTLKENGYHVWWGGKNDLVPAQHGFDAVCDIKHVPDPPPNPMRGAVPKDWRGDPAGDGYYSFYAGRIEKGAAPYYRDSDWAHVEGAIDFLHSYDGDAPFCLFLSLSYPHPPYAVEDPWYSLIDRDALPPRRPAPAPEAGKSRMIDEIVDRSRLRGWDEERWTELRATYYGMCARIDHQFGLVVDALKASRRYDETAVFFFPDHGDFTGDYDLVNKTYNLFEDPLTRVPFVVKPSANHAVRPGIRNALVELVDFPATVFDLTGIEPSHRHFGRSLLPVIADATAEHRDAVFAEGGRLYGEKMWDQRAVQPGKTASLYWPTVAALAAETPACGKATMCRTRTHKYVHRLYESDELYDLETDPGESTNRIDDPTLASVRAELKERTMRFYLETTDVIPPNMDRRE